MKLKKQTKKKKHYTLKFNQTFLMHYGVSLAEI